MNEKRYSIQQKCLVVINSCVAFRFNKITIQIDKDNIITISQYDKPLFYIGYTQEDEFWHLSTNRFKLFHNMNNFGIKKGSMEGIVIECYRYLAEIELKETVLPRISSNCEAVIEMWKEGW